MPDGREPHTIRTLSGINDVPAEQWDACAGADLPDFNPFVSHAFLAALENSSSACAETGWTPCHMVVEGSDGKLAACAPLYLKGHSYGEYVFDWAWADAYQRAGGRYYPKLLCAVPFSPVTGPRILIRDGENREGLRSTLFAAMIQFATKHDLSSVHVNFCTDTEWQQARQAGLLQRLGTQFHWKNKGYTDFDDFLAALSSRKRKTIRRERREATGQEVTLRTLRGDEIKERHWDAMYRFYLDTSNRKWGEPYLNRAFFSALGNEMKDRVVLFVAEDETQNPVAAALNILGGDCLYGRYWGSLDDYRFLHFEACYYRAIDFAIEHRLSRVEAGAQGEHKLARGYTPHPTYSAHWMLDSGFFSAVERFLDVERDHVSGEMTELSALSPFRRTQKHAPEKSP
ncbi:MAG: GNAT family N-acetyltransferase [Rhodospirillales bacterium]|nr:GNAT family N-acetyltransferase [Rhodospirillales bacterium]MCW8953072.1 GNAT family N-acetyltransferase [Rhodospirillales bacterium]